MRPIFRLLFILSIILYFVGGVVVLICGYPQFTQHLARVQYIIRLFINFLSLFFLLLVAPPFFLAAYISTLRKAGH